MRWTIALLFAASASVVLADAVPPPPKHCPPGQVGVTSHGGPHCVEAAPKDCPPGWYPQVGGTCVVQSCETDEQCGAGKQCKPADVCRQERVVTRRGREPINPPVKVVETVDVCGPQRSCLGDAKCDKGKVCLPRGVSKPGAWPKKPKK